MWLELVKLPGFWIGLILRVGALIMLPLASSIKEWYGPFLSNFLQNPILDPWQSWITNGGDPQAFPYGVGMLVALAPLGFVSQLGSSIFSSAAAYQATLLLFDVGLLVISAALSRQAFTKAVHFYWVSPITLISIYVLGFNDVIPVFFLMASVLLMRKGKFWIAGFVLAFALSIKLSMVLALPVFAILFIRNRNIRAKARGFAFALISGSAALISPLAVSSSAWLTTISENKEAAKIWAPAVQFGPGASILIVPLVFAGVLYVIWRVRRLNFELFEASLGLVFLVVVLSVQSSPGWYLWVLPLLLAVDTSSNRRTGLLVWLFGACFALANAPQILANLGFVFAPSDLLTDMLHTALMGAGILLALKVWRDGITANDFFVQSRKPFAIGIAGDSGVGKDTFASALIGVFGNSATTHLSGDDYHLWDRSRPMWQALTHLNPAANNLSQLERDSISLLSGRSVQVRHYNHATGIYEKKATLRSNDFLIFSGLHTFRLPSLPSLLDLSIFLEMDEGLRRSLKIERDVNIRGHSIEKVEKSLERRAPDVEKFINPQRSKADLIFKLGPSRSVSISSDGGNELMDVKFETRLGLDLQELKRVLVSLSQVEFEVEGGSSGESESVTISGNPDKAAIQAAAQILAPRVLDFCDGEPRWQSGAVGIMQLVFFAQLEHVLLRRALS